MDLIQFLQIANAADTAASLTFELPFTSVANTGTLQLLQGSQNASNTKQNPDAVVPVNSSINVGKAFNYTAPEFSVSVLTVKTQ